MATLLELFTASQEKALFGSQPLCLSPLPPSPIPATPLALSASQCEARIASVMSHFCKSQSQEQLPPSECNKISDANKKVVSSRHDDDTASSSQQRHSFSQLLNMTTSQLEGTFGSFDASAFIVKSQSQLQFSQEFDIVKVHDTEKRTSPRRDEEPASLPQLTFSQVERWFTITPSQLNAAGRSPTQDALCFLKSLSQEQHYSQDSDATVMPPCTSSSQLQSQSQLQEHEQFVERTEEQGHAQPASYSQSQSLPLQDASPLHTAEPIVPRVKSPSNKVSKKTLYRSFKKYTSVARKLRRERCTSCKEAFGNVTASLFATSQRRDCARCRLPYHGSCMARDEAASNIVDGKMSVVRMCTSCDEWTRSNAAFVPTVKSSCAVCRSNTTSETKFIPCRGLGCLRVAHKKCIVGSNKWFCEPCAVWTLKMASLV
eukprot:Opistho-2@90352